MIGSAARFFIKVLSARLTNQSNRNSMRRIIPFLIACLLSTTAIGRPPIQIKNTDALKKALQMKLDEWHKAGSFPGATLGVVLPDGESFGLAVGYSDRDARTPMKPAGRMLAGSVGKTFAAATALQLVKELLSTCRRDFERAPLPFNSIPLRFWPSLKTHSVRSAMFLVSDGERRLRS